VTRSFDHTLHVCMPLYHYQPDSSGDFYPTSKRKQFFPTLYSIFFSNMVYLLA